MAETNHDFIMKPKVDFCFKDLMDDPAIRRGFTSALLGVKPEDILEIILLPTHMQGDYPDDKLGILDLHMSVRTRDGIRHTNMEIHINPFPLWPERSLFYWSRMYTEQLKPGDPYDLLEKCLHVGILDFYLFPNDPKYYTQFHIWADDRRLLYTNKLEVHILELPKLADHDYPDNELLNWAKFFHAEQRKEMEELAKKDECIERAYERLVQLSADQEKRLAYEAREKAIRDYNQMMHSSYSKGRMEGFEEGQSKGAQAERCRFGQLILKLEEASRQDDIHRAAADPDYCESLFVEFHI